jgi:hypothetical protein
MNLGKFRHGLWALTSLGLIYSGSGFAQSTPSEFAEMSLTDLFAQSINEVGSSSPDQSPWSVAIQRSSVEFKGYLDGDDRVSDDEVLWSGPNSGELRTDKNFPVVPGKSSRPPICFPWAMPLTTAGEPILRFRISSSRRIT